ncbi:MAG TPA: hypothetical protein V6D29_21395 [Leptolyngbyaceae cyanobacterium]
MNATPENPGQTAEDPAHLARLKTLVENAIADGKLTFEEMAEIRDALMADGKLTLEEMELVRDVMRQKLGDAPLEFEQPSF